MNRGGFTALLYAAREGCIDCARQLVEGGADIDLTDPERVTPLALAINNLHFDLAAYLIERRRRRRQVGPVRPHAALSGRRHEHAADAGQRLDVRYPEPRQAHGPRHRKIAARRGRESEHPAETPTAVPQRAERPRRRHDPLRKAPRRCCARRAPAMHRPCELLLEHGALVDLPSNDGVTPLMAAAGVEYGLRVTRGRNRTEEGVLATMQLLLDAGADINARIVVEPALESGPTKGSTARRARATSRSTSAAGRCRVTSAVPHRTAIARRGAARLHVHRRVSRRERRRPRRPRTRTAARRSISRWATTARTSCGRPPSRTSRR